MTRVVDALNAALHRAMETNPDVIFLGEDILDPYGGAFKVARGLSTRFPSRVITTPISEAGIVGVGTGLALHGFRPVVEIMFGDFMTLVVDQLVNHASKMSRMYAKPLSVPLVIRSPMGGRRGYGPTHSQCIERLFLGWPGLDVVAVSPLIDPGDLLAAAILQTACPVLFVENKVMYASPIRTREALADDGWQIELGGGIYPTVSMTRQEGASDVTFVAYGGMVPLALEAARRLLTEEGLLCGIIVPHRISQVPISAIAKDLESSRRLVVMEETATGWGWTAEIVAALSGVRLDAPPQRVGARSMPVPAARVLEDTVLPQVDDICRAAIATVDACFE